MHCLTLGREICGCLREGARREWLVTNGLGGYASGTVSGVLTRRYHGLLVAARRPPVARTVTLAKIDVEVDYDGARYALGANEYADGTIHPGGICCDYLRRVHRWADSSRRPNRRSRRRAADSCAIRRPLRSVLLAATTVRQPLLLMPPALSLVRFI